MGKYNHWDIFNFENPLFGANLRVHKPGDLGSHRTYPPLAPRGLDPIPPACANPAETVTKQLEQVLALAL
jgi:hypothetical protein